MVVASSNCHAGHLYVCLSIVFRSRWPGLDDPKHSGFCSRPVRRNDCAWHLRGMCQPRAQPHLIQCQLRQKSRFSVGDSSTRRDGISGFSRCGKPDGYALGAIVDACDIAVDSDSISLCADTITLCHHWGRRGFSHRSASMSATSCRRLVL